LGGTALVAFGGGAPAQPKAVVTTTKARQLGIFMVGPLFTDALRG
jgi:hypothetical protein